MKNRFVHLTLIFLIIWIMPATVFAKHRPGLYSFAYSAINLPTDGYIVYNGDTLTGTITLNNLSLSIALKNATKPAERILYTDKALKSVVIYDADYGLLFLTRANSGDKELSRVVHTGKKLTLYDDRYCFRPTITVDNAHIKIVRNGKVVPLTSPVVSVEPMSALLKAVNKAYGLKLYPDDFTWGELLVYIDYID